MTRSDTGDITQLLQQVEQGDTEAHNRLAQLVRAGLKRIAANRLRRERPDHLYQTSDLVQEASMLADLRTRLRTLNPGAAIIDIADEGEFG
mgnify:CR=1 FL=1